MYYYIRPIAFEIHKDKNTERQTGTSERTIVLGQWPLQATVLAALRPDSLGILTRKKNPTRFDSIICTLCKKYIILCVRFGMIVQLTYTEEAMKTACNVEEKFNVVPVPQFLYISTNSHKLYKFAQIATAQCSVVCPRHKIPAMLS